MRKLFKIVIDDNNINLNTTNWIIIRNTKPTINNLLHIDEIVGDSIFVGKNPNSNYDIKLPIDSIIPVELVLYPISNNGVIDTELSIKTTNTIFEMAWKRNELTSEIVIIDDTSGELQSTIKIEDIYHKFHSHHDIVRSILQSNALGATAVKDFIINHLLEIYHE